MTPHFLVGLQVGESNTAEKGLNAQFCFEEILTLVAIVKQPGQLMDS